MQLSVYLNLKSDIEPFSLYRFCYISPPKRLARFGEYRTTQQTAIQQL